MDRNNNINSNRRPAPRHAGNGDFDRYNYVDRDVYSNGNSDRPGGLNRRPPKKKHTGRKVAIVLTSLVLIVAIGSLYDCLTNDCAAK